MTEYSEIRNYRQLVLARKSLDSRISEQERELGYRLSAAKEFYTPANLILAVLKRTTSMLNAGKVALIIVRYLKDYLTKRKEESARQRNDETSTVPEDAMKEDSTENQ